MHIQNSVGHRVRTCLFSATIAEAVPVGPKRPGRSGITLAAKSEYSVNRASGHKYGDSLSPPRGGFGIQPLTAGVAELVDAPDLGSGAFGVGVRVPSPAPPRISQSEMRTTFQPAQRRAAGVSPETPGACGPTRALCGRCCAGDSGNPRPRQPSTPPKNPRDMAETARSALRRALSVHRRTPDLAPATRAAR